jgi:molecular chaperone DnaK (HSP70)
VLADPTLLGRVRDEAERVKQRAQRAADARVEIPYLTVVAASRSTFVRPITRAELEELGRGRDRSPARRPGRPRARAGGLDARDVDQVLLVAA